MKDSKVRKLSIGLGLALATVTLTGCGVAISTAPLGAGSAPEGVATAGAPVGGFAGPLPGAPDAGVNQESGSLETASAPVDVEVNEAPGLLGTAPAPEPVPATRTPVAAPAPITPPAPPLGPTRMAAPATSAPPALAAVPDTATPNPGPGGRAEKLAAARAELAAARARLAAVLATRVAIQEAIANTRGQLAELTTHDLRRGLEGILDGLRDQMRAAVRETPELEKLVAERAAVVASLES